MLAEFGATVQCNDLYQQTDLKGFLFPEGALSRLRIGTFEADNSSTEQWGQVHRDRLPVRSADDGSGQRRWLAMPLVAQGKGLDEYARQPLQKTRQ